MALWLRKPLKSRLSDPVDIIVWGLRLRLKPRGNLSEQRLIMTPQFLDTLERKALTAALADGGVFFDIGANIGVYSYWIAASCDDRVRIEAFEPDPALGERTRFNLTQNAALSKINHHALALGNQVGEVSLVAGDGNAGENRIVADRAADGSAARVRMTTLPAFLDDRKIDRIDALKIDVEGHEVAVLKPLFDHRPEAVWPRLIVCEVPRDCDCEIHRLLISQGYELTERGRLNGLYRLPR